MTIFTFRRFANFLCFLFVLAFLGASPSLADPAVNVQDGKVALHGFDPVAYFTENEALQGKRKHEVNHGNARYRFASEDNKKLFESDPDRYLPQYGGFCSYGVVLGKKFDVDPYAYKIVQGRLFLQLDLGTQKVWARDQDRNIAIADRTWPRVKTIPAAELED